MPAWHTNTHQLSAEFLRPKGCRGLWLEWDVTPPRSGIFRDRTLLSAFNQSGKQTAGSRAAGGSCGAFLFFRSHAKLELENLWRCLCRALNNKKTLHVPEAKPGSLWGVWTALEGPEKWAGSRASTRAGIGGGPRGRKLRASATILWSPGEWPASLTV